MAYKIKSKKLKEKDIWRGVSSEEYIQVMRWVQHNPKKWDKAFYSGKDVQRKLIKSIINKKWHIK